MQERNIINGATATMVAPLLELYNSLIPFLLLAIVLIFVDSRFGVAAAKKRGEQTGLPTNVVLSAEGQTQRLANVSCGSSNCLAIYSSLAVTITPATAPAA